MRYLIPIDASATSLAPIEHVERVARRGATVEAVVLNVQPRFHRHVSQFTRKADRDALRQELSRAATAQAIERLSRNN